MVLGAVIFDLSHNIVEACLDAQGGLRYLNGQGIVFVFVHFVVQHSLAHRRSIEVCVNEAVCRLPADIGSLPGVDDIWICGDVVLGGQQGQAGVRFPKDRRSHGRQTRSF